MSGQSSFRGYWSIGEVVKRIVVLAQFNAQFRPDIKYLTLERRDLDLIRRWPKAAEAHEIFITETGVHWRGFELKDKPGLGRYQQLTVEQAEIT